MTRIVFMGTPDFAVPCLKALIDAGYTIPLVVTQPDKPVGRKRVLTAPPVKALALEHGLEVYQPATVKKNPEALERLAAAQADLFVVVAYGKILPQSVLDIPTQGCMNVHASLLPKYRGSAPIQWSLIEGEHETGVTTMLMDAGMDTGDMLLKATLPIAPHDTATTLSPKLSQLGAELLIKTIPGYLDGSIQPQVQDESQATVIPMLKKEDGEVNWLQPAQTILNRMRGLAAWPGSHSFFRGKSLKLKRAAVYLGESDYQGNPGQVLEVNKSSFLVRTGDGILEVFEVHLAGSKAMDAGSFARGQRLESAEFLGQNPQA